MPEEYDPLDEDDFEWTAEAFARAKPLREVNPQMIIAMTSLRKAGRPPKDDPLVSLTIRIPKSDLPKLRAMPGYHTKITQLVHQFVQSTAQV